MVHSTSTCRRRICETNGTTTDILRRFGCCRLRLRCAVGICAVYMKFKIIAVGKLKESYWKDALAEYVKRLSRFVTVQMVEVDECLSRGTQTEGEKARIKNIEGEAILAKLEGYVVAMDIDGISVDSERLSQLIAEQKQFYSIFTFVVGGSNGLSDAVKARANIRLSFGKITMPHQLFRVVLSEQLYRACCIEHNVAYHK